MITFLFHICIFTFHAFIWLLLSWNQFAFLLNVFIEPLLMTLHVQSTWDWSSKICVNFALEESGEDSLNTRGWVQCQPLGQDAWKAPWERQIVGLVGGDALEVLFELGIKGNEMKLKDACSLKEELWQTHTVYYKDITLLTKICIVKAVVLLVVIHGCENWTIEKAEHWRIDAFELCYCRRPLRVP